MKPDWREDQMCDIAFDMFLEDSKYDETENAIFTPVSYTHLTLPTT